MAAQAHPERIERYAPSGRAVRRLAEAGQTEHGGALLAAIAARRAELEGKLGGGMKESPVAREDWRYLIGQLDELKWLLSLPEAAAARIEQAEDYPLRGQD